LRKQPGDANNPNTITALFKELDETRFMYRTRTEDEIDANERVIKRKLIQIVFFHKEVIRFTQRFIAGKLLVINGTFNTNKLRLPLLINVSIINSGKTFPCASNYCLSETAESYDFFFQTLRQEIEVPNLINHA
jgi:MULE transposase domain